MSTSPPAARRKRRRPFRLLPLLLTAFAAASLAGCASTAQQSGEGAADPLEPFNRKVYAFNDVFDRFLLKPIAKGYDRLTPNVVRQGIGNFFSNLGYTTVILNGFLQGKPVQGLQDTGRLVLNTTIGIGGIVDVATGAGLEEHEEDFGQTLAVWGVPRGPYLVLPFMGPSTLRDAPATAVDFFTEGERLIDDSSIEDKLTILEIIDTRARLLAVDKTVQKAYDPYITIREAFLQRRQYLIHDGNPPLDDTFEEEFLDEEFLDEEPGAAEGGNADTGGTESGGSGTGSPRPGTGEPGPAEAESSAPETPPPGPVVPD